MEEVIASTQIKTDSGIGFHFIWTTTAENEQIYEQNMADHPIDTKIYCVA